MTHSETLFKDSRSTFYAHEQINPLTPELNPSAQRCLPRYFTGVLIFKGLTARRLYKSFGGKGLIADKVLFPI
jgi:hypothetical protein